MPTFIVLITVVMYKRTIFHYSILFGLLLVFINPLEAQVKYNPQFGITLQSLSDDKQKIKSTGEIVEASFSADIGIMAGIDFRFGSDFYFQPGVFFSRNVTITKLKGDTLSAEDFEDELIRSSLKMKALFGYDLVHKEGFKIRLNAGPTYDYIMSIDNAKDEIDFDESDFNAGTFNIDAGLGLDIWFITLEAGYSYGLSEAFDNKDEFDYDSRYSTVYVSAGIVLGSDEKKKKRNSSNE